MSDLLQKLGPSERRGSKPRCHLLTHGRRAQVSARLTALAAPFAQVSPTDHWMPVGFEQLEEAELDKEDLLPSDIRKRLGSWWLAPTSTGRRTPNFDIASTCTIEGSQGLLLVEAKAHDEELNKEAAGKRLTTKSSEERRASHDTIGAAICSAREGLNSETGLSWEISRDSHYQMSNRFAWAWKLTELGRPVVLVYLGFLRAEEMVDRGKPLDEHADWKRLVMAHSYKLVPSTAWGRRWTVNDQAFVPLIRSLDIPLPDLKQKKI